MIRCLKHVQSGPAGIAQGWTDLRAVHLWPGGGEASRSALRRRD